MKDSCPWKHQGSQKLLHWSAKDVRQWVCSIELDEYVGTLDKMGIHGPVMVSAVVMEEGENYTTTSSTFLSSCWMSTLAVRV